jgi:hypothetical protein
VHIVLHLPCHSITWVVHILNLFKLNYVRHYILPDLLRYSFHDKLLYAHWFLTYNTIHASTVSKKLLSSSMVLFNEQKSYVKIHLWKHFFQYAWTHSVIDFLTIRILAVSCNMIDKGNSYRVIFWEILLACYYIDLDNLKGWNVEIICVISYKHPCSQGNIISTILICCSLTDRNLSATIYSSWTFYYGPVPIYT